MSRSQPTDAAEMSAPEVWLEAHGDYLFAFAMSRVRDEGVAEDLVQDTLLAAIEGQATFAGRSSERTWLVGILRNKMLQHFRRSRQRTGAFSVELAPEVVEAQFNRAGKWKAAPRSWSADPEQLSRQEEFSGVLQRCLGKLPARVADAFLLIEQHQLSVESLCKTLEVSATNVYVMLHRARFALRQCLEKHWFVGEAGKRS